MVVSLSFSPSSSPHSYQRGPREAGYVVFKYSTNIKTSEHQIEKKKKGKRKEKKEKGKRGKIKLLLLYQRHIMPELATVF